jgi:hypothetical protein
LTLELGHELAADVVRDARERLVVDGRLDGLREMHARVSFSDVL